MIDQDECYDLQQRVKRLTVERNTANAKLDQATATANMALLKNARLRAALEWYAADDARLFEQGLVEHVDDRPATEALK